MPAALKNKDTLNYCKISPIMMAQRKLPCQGIPGTPLKQDKRMRSGHGGRDRGRDVIERQARH